MKKLSAFIRKNKKDIEMTIKSIPLVVLAFIGFLLMACDVDESMSNAAFIFLFVKVLSIVCFFTMVKLYQFMSKHGYSFPSYLNFLTEDDDEY